MLGARCAARIAPSDPGNGIDPRSGIRNGAELAAYTPVLAQAIDAVRAAGETPLVLGGDCSILLGCLLSLRDRGRHGLLFLDGHADFYDPASDPSGEAASMELALATGRGPAPLSNLDGRGPLVRDEDVAAVGIRDHDEQRRDGSPPLPATILELGLPEVRRRGLGVVADEALARLTRPELDGFWIHLDADVLDDALVRAVDYRLPGGLGWSELETLLDAAIRSGRVAGVDVTILNPDLDPDGGAVRGLARLLARGLVPNVTGV